MVWCRHLTRRWVLSVQHRFVRRILLPHFWLAVLGPRQCIGRKFATTEAVAFLTMLLRDWKVEPLLSGSETKNQWRDRVMQGRMMITFGVRNVPIRFTRRTVKLWQGIEGGTRSVFIYSLWYVQKSKLVYFGKSLGQYGDWMSICVRIYLCL
jgi:hypothetical protein